MAQPYPLRPIAAHELPGAYTVLEHAFHLHAPTEPELRHLHERLEFDRSLAAFDGDLAIGIAAAYSLRLSVPGAVTPTAGVTVVSVLPPYRRRGVLRSLMVRQLSDIRARGEPIAALWASEAGIYGRFGYGPASLMSAVRIGRGEGQLVPGAPDDPGLRLRLAEPEESRPELARVYDAMLPARPGLFAREHRWWNAALHDPEYYRDGATPLRCLLAENRSGPRGYVLYAASLRWNDDGLADAVITIRELMALDGAAAACLWRDLLSRDLTSEVVARNRPVDDPLLYLLADPRRARIRTSDALWIRVLDVPAALTVRRYAAPIDTVIDVTDELCPWNAGRWRLRVAGPGDKATCERTGQPADVALPVTALGAAYLGGTRLGALAGAGIVTQLRPGSLTTLSAAMSWDPAPWCPMIF